MSDTPVPPRVDINLMMDLFQGSDLAHGRTDITEVINAKGKREAKSWTIKSPANHQAWADHLAGTKGLGILPINSDSKVHWGAIDVDIYLGLSIENLNQKIQAHKMPLTVCRSKSGGPHIFLFVKEWVPATLMIKKLDAIAGWLGFGRSELYPKQSSIGTSAEGQSDYGNWINMPYFGGVNCMRYAYDQDNRALGSVAEFYDYVASRRLSAAELEDLKTPTPEDLLPGGPPCLNQILSEKPTDNRNIILANIAVYAKRAFPENWKAKVDEYNRMLPEPLGSSEVEHIKKSYEKKDYRYQCRMSPLCNFCDSSKCRKVPHGVGGNGELMPAQRSLTKIDTKPPVWWIDIILPDDKETRIWLTSDQLQQPYLFQKRCMEVLHRMPPLMKSEDWQPMIDDLMQRVTVIPVPEELSPIGQFKDLFAEFLQTANPGGSFEDLLRGAPYVDANFHYFRMRDLSTYLNNSRFNLLPQNEIIALLKSDYRAEKNQKNIAGKFIRYIEIPITHEPAKPVPLQPASFSANR